MENSQSDEDEKPLKRARGFIATTHHRSSEDQNDNNPEDAPNLLTRRSAFTYQTQDLISIRSQLGVVSEPTTSNRNSLDSNEPNFTPTENIDDDKINETSKTRRESSPLNQSVENNTSPNISESKDEEKQQQGRSSISASDIENAQNRSNIAQSKKDSDDSLQSTKIHFIAKDFDQHSELIKEFSDINQEDNKKQRTLSVASINESPHFNKENSPEKLVFKPLAEIAEHPETNHERKFVTPITVYRNDINEIQNTANNDNNKCDAQSNPNSLENIIKNFSSQVLETDTKPIIPKSISQNKATEPPKETLPIITEKTEKYVQTEPEPKPFETDEDNFRRFHRDSKRIPSCCTNISGRQSKSNEFQCNPKLICTQKDKNKIYEDELVFKFIPEGIRSVDVDEVSCGCEEDYEGSFVICKRFCYKNFPFDSYSGYVLFSYFGVAISFTVAIICCWNLMIISPYTVQWINIMTGLVSAPIHCLLFRGLCTKSHRQMTLWIILKLVEISVMFFTFLWALVFYLQFSLNTFWEEFGLQIAVFFITVLMLWYVLLQILYSSNSDDIHEDDDLINITTI